MGMNWTEKLEQLQALFREIDQALIAYSGGVDSTLVAKIAYDVLGDRALAVTAVSASLLPEELEDAKIQAATIGIAHKIVQTQEMDNPNYTSNPVNADDLHDYRPGIQAAKERGARSPLAEIGVTKAEVRQISQQLGLPWWDKPAQPCLSSRFPYGEEITIAKLQRVGRAEIYLRNLGWQNLRVRSEGDTARIELSPDKIKDFVTTTDLPSLVSVFQNWGFIYVTLDLEGYRSGKLNQVLPQVALRKSSSHLYSI